MITAVAIFVGTSVEAAPATEPPTRFSKRGPRAWENFLSSPLLPLRDGGTTRLLVHAIGDASALQWIPKVKEFLASSKLSGTDLSLPDGMDMALAQYMDWQCYGEQLSPSSGTLLLFGLVCLLPEIKGKLPLAARSLKSWARLAITSEGGPVPEEIIFLAAIDLIESGYVYEGCWVLCQYDIYGREQDMEQLHGADVHYDGKTLAIELGQASRGESVKTGHNQGVLLRRAEVIDIMLALRDSAGRNKIFPITQEKFRQSWHRTMRRLGLSFAGPPHAIRHSGPSEDLARQRCSLEDVRRRGRWKGMDSVQRYTKTFALTRFRAKVPEATRARAAVVEADLRRALLKALGSTACASSGIAQRCSHALRLQRGIHLPVAAARAPKGRPGRPQKRATAASARSQRLDEEETDETDEGGAWATD
jgi:hypothetical protein